METLEPPEIEEEEPADNMVLINGIKGRYMDGYLKANLDHLKKDLHKDYDAFLICDGQERKGKSTCMIQNAWYMDETFDLDRVCFTAKQFIDAVTDAKQYQAIVFDEAQGYLSSRRALSKFNVALVQVMSEMGFKNLFIGICIPSFFELDRYPAVHRSVGLINVYERGRLACYNYHAKKNLYFEGKKMMNYSVRPDFIGRFGKWFPLDYEAYKEKKRKFALQPLEDIQKSRLKKMADAAVDTLKGQKPDVIMDTGSNDGAGTQ